MFDTMPKTNFVPKSFSDSHNVGMLGDSTPPDLCPSPYNISKDNYETLQYKIHVSFNCQRFSIFLKCYIFFFYFSAQIISQEIILVNTVEILPIL